MLGIKRRSSSFNAERVEPLYEDLHEEGLWFFMHYGDMTNATNFIRIVQQVQPDKIYNFAVQSRLQVSFETPEYTANADANGPLRLLEALRILRMRDQGWFYQANRPAEVDHILGDVGKARKVLSWQPRIGRDDLVAEMVAGDRTALANDVNQYKRSG